MRMGSEEVRLLRCFAALQQRLLRKA
jgi:hypothetical protein